MDTDQAPSVAKDTGRYIGNILLPSVILVLTGICFAQTFDFPGGGGDVGPAGVPYLWIGFTTLFGVALIVQAALKKMPADPKPGRWGFVLAFFGWLVLYLIAIQNIGYYVSTFLFLAVSMFILGYRKYWLILTIASCWLVFCYFVFAKLLYIPLPQGPLTQMLLG